MQIDRYTLVLVAKDKQNHLIVGSLQRFTQDNWSLETLSGKANGWRNRERVVLDHVSNLEWVRSKGFFGEPLWRK